MDDLKGQVTEHQARKEALQVDVEGLLESQAVLNTQNATLRARVEGLEAQLSAVSKKNTQAAEEEGVKRKNDYASLERRHGVELDSLQTQLATAVQALETKSGMCTTLEEQMEQLAHTHAQERAASVSREAVEALVATQVTRATESLQEQLTAKSTECEQLLAQVASGVQDPKHPDTDARQSLKSVQWADRHESKPLLLSLQHAALLRCVARALAGRAARLALLLSYARLAKPPRVSETPQQVQRLLPPPAHGSLDALQAAGYTVFEGSPRQPATPTPRVNRSLIKELSPSNSVVSLTGHAETPSQSLHHHHHNRSSSSSSTNMGAMSPIGSPSASFSGLSPSPSSSLHSNHAPGVLLQLAFPSFPVSKREKRRLMDLVSLLARMWRLGISALMSNPQRETALVSRRWVSDGKRSACKLCQCPFSLTRRRYVMQCVCVHV
jgi:hypothetical protein